MSQTNERDTKIKGTEESTENQSTVKDVNPVSEAAADTSADAVQTEEKVQPSEDSAVDTTDGAADKTAPMETDSPAGERKSDDGEEEKAPAPEVPKFDKTRLREDCSGNTLANDTIQKGKSKLKSPKYMYLSYMGTGHVRSGISCQDYSTVITKDTYTLMAVSDGHGSKMYTHSAFGSKFAVKAIAAELDEMAKLSDTEFMRYFINKEGRRNILLRWRKMVLDDAKGQDALKHDNDDVRLMRYGATLLFVIIRNGIILTGQLGDGAIVLMDSEYKQLGTLDEEDGSDVTLSMCNQKPEYMQINAYKSADFPFIFVCSDGIEKIYTRDVFMQAVEMIRKAYLENRGKPEKFIEFVEGFIHMCSGNTSDDISFIFFDQGVAK